MPEGILFFVQNLHDKKFFEKTQFSSLLFYQSKVLWSYHQVKECGHMRWRIALHYFSGTVVALERALETAGDARHHATREMI
ncbi:MAG: hypothetical protein E7I13_02380 [Negativicoccus succinicivorans]|nr:hypothetical protein [Negativicoccus succinicivorans]